MRRWRKIVALGITLATVAFPLVPAAPARAAILSTSVVMRLKVPTSGDVDNANVGYLHEGQYATVNISNWNSPTGGSGTGWSYVAAAYDGSTSTAAIYNQEGGWSTNYTFTFASANVVGWRFWVAGGVTEAVVDIYDSTNLTWKNKFSGSSPQGAWITIDFSETVVTTTALAVASSSAVLGGSITSMGSSNSCAVHFQYGTTTSYGDTTDEASTNVSGPFSQIVTGLSYDTTYHFRAVGAFDASIYIFGQDNVFTTKPPTGSSTDIRIIKVGVFSDFLETGDILIAIEARNNYTNQFPGKRPGSIFTFELVGTDNTTIIAASPVANWGDRPGSIYLNHIAATSIIYQAAYYVKMVGNADVGSVVTTYQLQTKDWYGFDKGELEQWCRGVAYNMAASDSRGWMDYLKLLTDQGNVLTDEVGGYFTTGIPGISQVLPNLFTTSQRYPKFPAGSNANTWDNLTAWQTYVGPSIAADATVFAAPFGVQGRDFMAGLIAMGVIGFLLIVVGATGGQGALGAVLLAIPLIWLGYQFRIVPSYAIGLLALAFGFFVIRQFIVKTL